MKDEVSEEVDSTGDMEAQGLRELGSWVNLCLPTPPPGWKEPLCLVGWRFVMLSYSCDGPPTRISCHPPLPGVPQLHVFGTSAVLA